MHKTNFYLIYNIKYSSIYYLFIIKDFKFFRNLKNITKCMEQYLFNTNLKNNKNSFIFVVLINQLFEHSEQNIICLVN